MSAQPVIFISAVGNELKSARELCGRLLTSFGYRVTWQENSAANGQDALFLLRPKIEYVDAVFALIGKQYGPEPKEPSKDFGRVSYAQYEVKFAQSVKRPLIFVRCDGYPAPEGADATPEAPEVVALQQKYVAALHAQALLLRTANSPEALESVMARLRSELPQLAPNWPMRVAAGVAAVALALGGWWMYAHRAPAKIENPQEERLLAAVREFPMLDAGLKVDAGLKSKQPGAPPAADTRAEAYVSLGKKLSLEAALLQRLEGYAASLQENAAASLLDRARAAYTAGNYAKAEQLYLDAAKAAQSASPARLAEAVDALELAGWSARARADLPKALEHFRTAASQTNQNRDAQQWARLQHAIAFVLADLGKSGEAESVLKKMAEGSSAAPVEVPKAASSRIAQANKLIEQGKFPEAQTAAFAWYQECKMAHGDEHEDTLEAAWTLARALRGQGRLVDAREFARRAVEGGRKTLGPDDPKRKTYERFQYEIRDTAEAGSGG